MALKLDAVRVEVSSYGSPTRRLAATRSYPNLAGQDTQHIPKSIKDSGHISKLTLKRDGNIIYSFCYTAKTTDCNRISGD